MRRRLIKQGGHSLTVYLPKKWVREHRLQAGDDVEIEQAQGNLVILPGPSRAIREISFDLPHEKESVVRTLLVNAYRQGYDKITVTVPRDMLQIRTIVHDHLTGFDLSTEGDAVILESVAEPSTERFDKMVERQFHILLDIVRGVGARSIRDDVVRMQRYDNFLKRCIAKRILSSDAGASLWQFLSTLVHAAKQILHLEEHLSGRALDPSERKALSAIEEMLALLQRGFLKGDLDLLGKLHERSAQFRKDGAKVLESDPQAGHLILSAAWFVYLANSPAASIIHASPA